MEEKIMNTEDTKQVQAFEQLRKELQLTRIFCIIVAVLLGVVITGGILLMNMMKPVVSAINEMQPAIQKMEQIDVEMLNEKLAQLDVEVLNEKIEQLDIESLNATLNSIQKAQNTLEALTESVKNSFSSSFSGLFGLGNNGGMD